MLDNLEAAIIDALQRSCTPMRVPGRVMGLYLYEGTSVRGPECAVVIEPFTASTLPTVVRGIYYKVQL